MRIYTKTGDAGETGLFGGQRVGKDNPRLEAYGTVDELNAVLGWARVALAEPEFVALVDRVQRQLLTLGSDLATPELERESVGQRAVPRIVAEHVGGLESEIDRLGDELPPLTRFILLGGGEGGARLHIARAVCRRAERLAVALAREAEINPEAIRYLNRLSDFLFVLARAANHREGTEEPLG